MTDVSRPAPRRWRPALLTLQAVGSLRVTVGLFVLGLVLVFFGTLAQIDGGLWAVMDGYFRSFFVWIPLQLLVQFAQIFLGVSKGLRIGGVLPFPGGFTIGIALLTNVVAAYTLRIPGYLERWRSYALMILVVAAVCLAGYLTIRQFGQWGFLIAAPIILGVAAAALAPFRRAIFFPGNRIGIITVHVGLVVMLVGEFVTAVAAVEGRMVLEEGETTNAVIQTRRHELAFTELYAREDAVTVIPGRLLRPGQTLRNAELPCEVEIIRWMPNSVLLDLPTGRENPATRGVGLRLVAVERSEAPGASSQQTIDVPSAYVRLTDRNSGADLGTYLLSVHLGTPETVTLGGREYGVSLRFEHVYKPYSLRLERFTFERYEGTDMAKDFASRVRLIDPETGDDREVTIRMNEPLRHRGDTYFQADWNRRTERGTVLQVVRNPAWQLPYWSCAIVALGMLMHFGLNLINFLARMAGQGA